MSRPVLILSKLSLVLALALPATACLAAAAAGAAGGVYLTTRGAESLVEGPIDEVTARAEAVMSEMQIAKDGESSERGGDERELKGKKGDLDVTIQLRRENPTTTKVEVTARENLAEWDKEYAQQVLERIVKQG
jgi:hypothetical protein